jgi:WXG100 family type VII secretion target
MASGTSMTIDSEQVRMIATQIETDNTNLKALLDSTKTTIDALGTTWTGQASTATISAYEEFSTKYFASYEDVLAQYVKFLRNNVADQYDEVEKLNASIGDGFK